MLLALSFQLYLEDVTMSEGQTRIFQEAFLSLLSSKLAVYVLSL
jgi:hypothetical protein